LLDVTAEALRANIDWKSPELMRVGGSIWSKISGRSKCPAQPFFT